MQQIPSEQWQAVEVQTESLAELSWYGSHSQHSGYNVSGFVFCFSAEPAKLSWEPHSTQTCTSGERGDLAFHNQGGHSGSADVIQ